MLIAGATGTGKSYLACALGHAASEGSLNAEEGTTCVHLGRSVPD